MSGFNYGRTLQTVDRLIKRFGGPVKIVATNITPNPTQGWKPGTEAPEENDGSAVFLNYEQKLIDGTVIQQGDQKVLLSPLGLTIEPEFVGYLLRGTEKWSILKVEPLNPGDTRVLYTLQVRQ